MYNTVLYVTNPFNITANLIDVQTFNQSGDKIEKNEMGGECSAYGGEKRSIQDVGEET
jgi:hypothetical protein